MKSVGCLVALVVAAGCGNTSQTVVCNPACPAGSHCSDTGCVADGDRTDDDLAASEGDAGLGCPQPCAAASPFCAPNRSCVPCLIDSHCPLGQICKQSGTTFACVPGCADDGRCGALGGPMRCCDGRCLDTSKDAQNCGACGTVCGSQHSVARCIEGKCAAGSCLAGWGDCNLDPGDGCEVSLRTDPKNCTACGMVCSIQNAIAGCSAGGVPSCYIAACNFGFDDCNGNPKDGCETSTVGDVKNCGGCGMACPAVPHASVGCLNGGCALKTCDAGYADCDGNPKTGCEISLVTDKSNCGRCGLACGQGQVCINSMCTCPPCNFPNAMSACVNNNCALGACNPGFANCDANPANGCELPVTSDPKNCGGCGVACAQGLVCTNGGCTCPQCNIPNARTACVNNQCVLDACLQGFADCNKNPADGCEVNTVSDKANCGACGVVCGGGNPFCMSGVCVALPPTCRVVNGVRWCYDPNCGVPCNQTCMDLNLPLTIDNPTWLAAQINPQQCIDIATAFGLPNNTSIASYSYGCVENEAKGDTVGGALTGRIICSSSAGCPQQLRTTMDQVGVACANGGRHAICPCQ